MESCTGCGPAQGARLDESRLLLDAGEHRRDRHAEGSRPQERVVAVHSLAPAGADSGVNIHNDAADKLQRRQRQSEHAQPAVTKGCKQSSTSLLCSRLCQQMECRCLPGQR